MIIHLTKFPRLYDKKIFIKINDVIAVNSEMYELVGVVCHTGPLSGGHYFSFCKREDQWYEFNDSIICKVINKSLVTNQQYFLFYSKIQ